MDNKNNPIKINTLQIENVKKVQSVSFTLSPDGLTLIGGNNANGKTSILDGIAFLLGGANKKPTNLKREGSVGDPYLKATLSNGITVERKGPKSALKITDPKGAKSGQALLNSFISELALDLPKFMNGNDAQKAEVLLQTSGIGDHLKSYDQQIKELYDERTVIGRECDKKQKYAESIHFYSDLPDAPLNASDLLEKHKSVLQKNADNQKIRNNADELFSKLQNAKESLIYKEERKVALQQQLSALETEITVNQKDILLLKNNHQVAVKPLAQLKDECTEEVEKQINELEQTNAKIRINLDKKEAMIEAEKSKGEYNLLSARIDEIRKKRKACLDKANMPLPELSVEDGKLIYKGQPWDCMSGAEQLIVSTAIVRMLKPQCGFVLMDKLEQMDSDTLKNFDEWLKKEGLQNIATIVGKREECQIIIEDGLISEQQDITLKTNNLNNWGKFD